jgi:hypothetical protein
MARYYFHLLAGDRLIPDEEGVDLPDLSAVHREVQLSARELLAEAIKTGKPRVAQAFVVADETGREIHAVALASILPEPFKK